MCIGLRHFQLHRLILITYPSAYTISYTISTYYSISYASS